MYTRKFIHAGELYVGIEPTEIVTVLGSCVSVCLYDSIRKVSAMNHYLLPVWNGSDIQNPKYGEIAIPRTIETLVNTGSDINNLEAKIFGGASMHNMSSENMMIGKRNIMIAKDILRKYNLPIRGEDVGGTRGRKIMMRSDIGKVMMRYVSEE